MEMRQLAPFPYLLSYLIFFDMEKEFELCRKSVFKGNDGYMYQGRLKVIFKGSLELCKEHLFRIHGRRASNEATFDCTQVCDNSFSCSENNFRYTYYIH